MYTLPDALRERLKEPLGLLVDESGLLKLLKDKPKIVSVGDKVTYTLLKNDFTPVMCIVDYIIERSTYDASMMECIASFPGMHIRVDNPPKGISDELWDAIDASYNHIDNGPICIEVDGEEDLAALAAIVLAPSDVTVIYGLPNRGVVVVDATDANKKIVKDILNRM